jgi:predicted nucleic acid-binding protein
MIGIVDTSVLVAAHEPSDTTPDLAGFERLYISSLSLAELEVGLALAATVAEYRERAARFDAVKARFGAGLPFDDSCATALRKLLAHILKSGGDPKAHRMDRMIAATALAKEAVVVTRNPGDFAILAPLVEIVER